mgnify:CR=1 FL=1
MGHAGKLPGHLCSRDHANRSSHQVERFFHVPRVLIHHGLYMLFMLCKDTFNGLEDWRVEGKSHVGDTIGLHELVTPVVMDTCVVIEDNASIGLHLPR